MKKIAFVLAIASLALVGCKKKDEKKAEPAKTEPAAKPAEPTAAEKPAEPAVAEPAAVEPAAAGDDTSTGLPECDDLVKRYTSCDKMPAEAKTAFLDGAKAWKQAVSAPGVTDDVKKTIADSCKQAATAADAAFKAVGC